MKKLIFIMMFILLSSIVLATAPVIDTVDLTTTNPATNYTIENLTSTHTFHDDDGDDVTAVYNWYKEDVLNATTLITSGLIDYYPFDNDILDYYGTLDGTNHGTTQDITDYAVNASFDFTGDYVDLSNDASLDFTTDFSFSFWFKSSPVSHWQVVIARDSWTAGLGYCMLIQDRSEGTQLAFYHPSGDYVRGADMNSFITNTWNHVVVTVSDSGSDNDVIIYLNGQENLTGTMTYLTSNPTGTTYIGSRHRNTGTGTADLFNGNIDEMMIFNRPLTPSEVKQIYYGSAYGGDVMDSSRTSEGDNWILGITGYDSTEQGVETNSTGVLILSVPLPRIIASWWNAVTNILRATINEDGLLYLNGTMIIESITGTYSNDEAYLCVYNNGSIFSKDGACA